MIYSFQFFTWNEVSKGCGIRRFTPTNYIKVPGQSSATRNGKVLEDLVLVGKAVTVEDRPSCFEACEIDDQCQSATFNDETSANPMICALNYGPIERTLPVGLEAGISSAPKNC